MTKVSVIGAGAVGATTADVIAYRELADEVVLLDVKEGFAEGKALDIYQTTSLLGMKTRVSGTTNDYSKTANSDVVVITSGIPRKPTNCRYSRYSNWWSWRYYNDSFNPFSYLKRYIGFKPFKRRSIKRN